MAERWLPVPGFSGYQISDEGRVHSLKSGQILKPFLVTSGHLAVGLYRDRIKHTLNVHTLVAKAFVGPRPADQEVRHLDGDHTHNALSNLDYGTRSENVLDRVRHGVHHQSNKTHCPQGHEYDSANTYTRPDRGGQGRNCRACVRDAVRRSRLVSIGRG